VWQTVYVIHLLFANVKRIQEHKEKAQHALTNMIMTAGEDLPGMSEFSKHDKGQLELVMRTQQEQTELSKGIIASSVVGFAMLYTAMVMVTIPQDYDENGNQTLTASYSSQAVYVLGKVCLS
jgi:hypothetical protein